MAGTFRHKGLCVGPVTPMKDNGDINVDVIPFYIEHLVRNNVNAVFVNGTTGEGTSLTISERKTVAEGWVEFGRATLEKIIIHCGALSLRDAQDLALHAENVGADAVAAIPSFYFPIKNYDSLISNLAAIASAAPKTPFIYYHNPARTYVDLDMATFLLQAKARIPTLAGIKWAGPDLAGALKVKTVLGDDFLVMWANDDVLLGSLTLGINSFNGSTYSFTAPLASRIVECYENGDYTTAKTEQMKLKKTIDIVEKDGDWLQRHKALLVMMGIPVGPPRLPLLPLTENQHCELGRELTDLGFFGWI